MVNTKVTVTCDRCIRIIDEFWEMRTQGFGIELEYADVDCVNDRNSDIQHLCRDVRKKRLQNSCWILRKRLPSVS
jgi:flagellar biosynthesis/type III secretory pathway chaperone